MKIGLGILALFWKIIVGTVFCITALIFYPFLAFTVSKPKFHRLAFKGFVYWSWTFRILLFYHVIRIQKTKLPDSALIFAPNHASFLDIFLLPSLFPKHPFLFMGKAEILSYPIIKTYFKSFNIPVFRDNKIKAAKSFVQAKKALTNNWSIVIFPEGGIPDWDRPRMMEFKDGAFLLAKGTNVPIVPITFENNFSLFSDPNDWFGPARPGLSKVIIHAPISSEKVQEMSLDHLKKECFNTINAPLIERYPRLTKNV